MGQTGQHLGAASLWQEGTAPDLDDAWVVDSLPCGGGGVCHRSEGTSCQSKLLLHRRAGWAACGEANLATWPASCPPESTRLLEPLSGPGGWGLSSRPGEGPAPVQQGLGLGGL